MLKKTLLAVLLILVAGAVAFSVVVAVQPTDFRIVRSAVINAPPAAVFAQVNDFHNWDAWSPWTKLDPKAVNTFEGPSAGTGAIFKWSGNDKVGEGLMTLTDSKPNEFIKIKLEFIKPFPSSCTTDFTFKAEGDQTIVTWEMAGENDFVGKAFCLFMDMDKTVGGDFDKGLANLKAVVEAKKNKNEIRE